MAFSNFTHPAKTASELGLIMKNGDLLAPASAYPPPEWMTEQLAFHVARAKRPFSEIYAREYLISPIFSFAQMRHARLNMFSSDFYLEDGQILNGTPDYLLSYPTEEGAYDPASQFPLLAVAEAKNETFNSGWAQCAAELYVCRRINEKAGKNGGIPLWGIVTNGLFWEFGRLEGARLVRHQAALYIDPLEKLLGAIMYIFSECLKNGEKIAGETADE